MNLWKICKGKNQPSLEEELGDSKLADAHAARIIAGAIGGSLVNLVPPLIQTFLPEDYDSISKFHQFSQLAASFFGAIFGSAAAGLVSILTKDHPKIALPGYVVGASALAFIGIKIIDYLNTPFFMNYRPV